MIDAGLIESYVWQKLPYTIEIGTNVTKIGPSVFWNCSGLTSVTIPDSVMSIGNDAFSQCVSLKSVTFSGKDKATVQNMGY